MSNQVVSLSEMTRVVNDRVAHDQDKVYSLQMLTFVAHFNFYRIMYRQLSFNDKKRLYNLYMELFPEDTKEESFDGKFVIDSLKTIVLDYLKTIKDPLHVAELGGYQGELALRVMGMYRVNWTSFDIIKHQILRELDSYNFTEYVLEKELWQSGIDLSHIDVFVSMHTLEHFSNDEFTQLIAYVAKQKIPYLILQIPLKREGQDWRNFLGAHVLTYGSDKVKELLSQSYVLVSEVPKGKRIRDGWCSFWRLKNE